MNTATKTRVPSPDSLGVEASAAPTNVNIPAVFIAPKQATEPPITPMSAPPSPVSVAKIAGAIAAIMTDIGVVAKDGQNKFHNYAYAKMEDILKRLTPLMARNGLVVFQTEVGRSMFDDDKVVAVQYAFTVCHSSGEIWPDRPLQTGMSRCRDSKGGFDDKALNKAHTAARKYFLLSLFQIPTGDDDDADSHDAAPRSAPRRPNIPSPDAAVEHDADGVILDDSVSAFMEHCRAHIDTLTTEAAVKSWWASEELGKTIAALQLPQDQVDILKAWGMEHRKTIRTASGTPQTAQNASSATT